MTDMSVIVKYMQPVMYLVSRTSETNIVALWNRLTVRNDLESLLEGLYKGQTDDFMRAIDQELKALGA